MEDKPFEFNIREVPVLQRSEPLFLDWKRELPGLMMSKKMARIFLFPNVKGWKAKLPFWLLRLFVKPIKFEGVSPSSISLTTSKDGPITMDVTMTYKEKK